MSNASVLNATQIFPESSIIPTCYLINDSEVDQMCTIYSHHIWWAHSLMVVLSSYINLRGRLPRTFGMIDGLVCIISVMFLLYIVKVGEYSPEKNLENIAKKTSNAFTDGLKFADLAQEMVTKSLEKDFTTIRVNTQQPFVYGYPDSYFTCVRTIKDYGKITLEIKNLKKVKCGSSEEYRLTDFPKMTRKIVIKPNPPYIRKIVVKPNPPYIRKVGRQDPGIRHDEFK